MKRDLQPFLFSLQLRQRRTSIHPCTRALLLAVTFLIICSSLSSATIRYVSKTGSSTPPYTSWETAADSIQKCINISQFGDTIYVANGIYKEQVVMIPGLSLIGAGMDSCVIDTRGFPLSSPFFSVKVLDNCYFAYFQIVTYSMQRGFGIRIAGANAVVVSNRIRLAVLGIDVFTAGYNIVKNNFILEVKEGIECFFTNSLIDSNFVFINMLGNGGISLALNSNPYIRDNFIKIDYHNAIGIGGGFNLSATIKNNIIYVPLKKKVGTESHLMMTLK